MRKEATVDLSINSINIAWNLGSLMKHSRDRCYVGNIMIMCPRTKKWGARLTKIGWRQQTEIWYGMMMNCGIHSSQIGSNRLRCVATLRMTFSTFLPIDSHIFHMAQQAPSSAKALRGEGLLQRRSRDISAKVLQHSARNFGTSFGIGIHRLLKNHGSEVDDWRYPGIEME